MTGSYQAAGEIEDRLKEEEEEKGAFYLSLPSFRDSYRLFQRILERNGQSAYLMVITLVDGKGRPAEGTERQEEFFTDSSRCDPEKPSKGRFLYQIQPFSVSDPSYRNQ